MEREDESIPVLSEQFEPSEFFFVYDDFVFPNDFPECFACYVLIDDFDGCAKGKEGVVEMGADRPLPPVTRTSFPAIGSKGPLNGFAGLECEGSLPGSRFQRERHTGRGTPGSLSEAGV